MADLIARSLKPGGRFVTYRLRPDDDSRQSEPRLPERCGLDYAHVSGPHCQLIIGAERLAIWQWSRATHETCLRRAGLIEIRWHPLQLAPHAPDVAALASYITKPSCIVLSARKVVEGGLYAPMVR